MAAGLPIVSTAVGGVPQLLQNGKEGFIVQAGYAEQLSDAMMTLLRDCHLRRAMGAAAATQAKEKFDVPAMVRAYEELYRKYRRLLEIGDTSISATNRRPHERIRSLKIR